MNRKNWGEVYRQFCSSINQSSKCLKPRIFSLPWYWEFHWWARKSIVLVKLAGIFCVWLLQVMQSGGQWFWTLKISQKVWWLSIVDPFLILAWNWLQMFLSLLAFCFIVGWYPPWLTPAWEKEMINLEFIFDVTTIVAISVGGAVPKTKISDVSIYLYLHRSGQQT